MYCSCFHVFTNFSIFRCAETVRMDARLRAPFFGLTATQLRCCDNSCGFKVSFSKILFLKAAQKVRYDSCSVISVQIPKTSVDRTVTLELLLRKYFCMEVIRGASCDECKKRTGRVDSGLFKKQGFSKVSLFYVFSQSIENTGIIEIVCFSWSHVCFQSILVFLDVFSVTFNGLKMLVTEKWLI